jgi:predicted transcriptional regulator
MRAWEFITETPKTPQATIDLTKQLRDQGLTNAQIGSRLDLSVSQVNHLLKKYHPERIKKQNPFPREVINSVNDLRNQGFKYAEIAKTLDLTWPQVNNILALYATDRSNKRQLFPEDLMPTFVDMYRKGQSGETIVRNLKLDISNSAIENRLRKLPNWEDIRADYYASRRFKPKGPTMTTIHRPGTIGNLRGKGPNSKHMYGVFTPKKI